MKTKAEVVIEGRDDGSHFVTVYDPQGGISSWTVPADVSLERIEEILKDAFGDHLGKRTVEVKGTRH